jgi:hypothetical protein
MTIDEGTRNGIHNWLVGAMGEHLGDSLMSMLPPTGWAEVATKHDLAQLEERLGLRFEMFDRRFEEVDRRFEEVDRRFGSIDLRFDQMERTIIGALDGRVAQTARAMFFALAGLLIALTTIIVSVVLAVG